eukprot:TRINITY_DN12043_c0_g1_i5.p2 TRINITY_DN12043_c0_g1~~TRINITY_DN12043_c0_g1_i5.p2  ORF type:complete len:216 (-),score=32.00 TRINITY_DN12043_c0_g1_i5:387-1034(-)
MPRGQTRLFVGNLRDDTTERDIEKEFGRYGRLRKVWVARRPPGFAFVEYDDYRDAEEAVRKVDGLHGWQVEYSRETRSNGFRRERGSVGGGGGGGGGRPRGDLRCYECGELGHFARDCMRRMQNPRGRYRPYEDDRGGRRGGGRPRSRSPSRSVSRGRDDKSSDRRRDRSYERKDYRNEDRDRSRSRERGEDRGRKMSVDRSDERNVSPVRASPQ